MSFTAGFEIAASGLSAQRARLNATSSNLANAETTRTEDGGVYRRKQVMFRSTPEARFDDNLGAAMRGVEVDEIAEDPSPTRWAYEPGHPDANADGFVEYPNVNVVEEMAEMVVASRSYEANATAFETLKSMAQRALSI
jgi:flagellar basal-body rod protein FlgC